MLFYFDPFKSFIVYSASSYILFQKEHYRFFWRWNKLKYFSDIYPRECNEFRVPMYWVIFSRVPEKYPDSVLRDWYFWSRSRRKIPNQAPCWAVAWPGVAIAQCRKIWIPVHVRRLIKYLKVEEYIHEIVQKKN